MTRILKGEMRPMLDITVEPEGGAKVRVDISARVRALTFIDSESKADKLTIEVINDTGDAWDSALFAKGNILIVSWGYAGYMSPPREMVITGSKGGVILNVEAKDRSILMHRETRSETYDDMTRSEVATLIAARNGFGPERRTIEETTERIEAIVQPNVSDIRMLRSLAHKQGFACWVDHTGLHWRRRPLDQPPVRTFIYEPARRRDLEFSNRNAIESYSVENDLTAKPAKTKLAGLDPDTKQPINVEASDAETSRDTLSRVVEVRDFETGEWKKVTRTVVEETKPTTATTAEAAKERADGRFRKVTEKAVKLNLSGLIGDPLLLAKTVVDVVGIAKRIDGRYYLEEVEHSISASGYKCSAKAQTDGTGGGSSINDILFPPPETPANDASAAAASATSILEDARSILAGRPEVANRPISDGAQVNITGADQLDRELADLARRMREDPNDAEAFQRARDVGKALRTSAPGLEGIGYGVESAGKMGGAQARGGRSKARVNQHPPATRRDTAALKDEDWLDEEERETREWYDEA